ncbi:hypothetical protein RKD18_000358 [Streptomyces phaeoluteigriseus]
MIICRRPLAVLGAAGGRFFLGECGCQAGRACRVSKRALYPVHLWERVSGR